MCFTKIGIFKANKTVYSLLYIFCIKNANKKIKQANRQTNKRTNIAGHYLHLYVDYLGNLILLRVLILFLCVLHFMFLYTLW